MRIECPFCKHAIPAEPIGPRTATIHSQAGTDEALTDGGKDEMASFSCPYCRASSDGYSISSLTVLEP